MITLETSHSWPIYGHDWAVDYLHKGLAHQRTRHAYLITGPQSIGKMALAHAFAMTLNCEQEDEGARPCGICRSCKLTHSGNHPDMLYSENDPFTGTLKIDAIRAVMRLIALKPFSARFRIAIFQDFDRAQPRAQDALLKTLEEAPPHAILLVLAQSTEKVLPTITSRCQMIRLRPVPTETVRQVLTMYGAGDDRANLLARLSSGRIGWALSALRDEAILQQRETALNLLIEAINGNRAKRFSIAEGLSKDTNRDKASLRTLLELWTTYWRDVLLLALDSPVKPCNSDRRAEMQRIVSRFSVDEARAALGATQRLIGLLDTNANVRLALEVMFLDYPGLER